MAPFRLGTTLPDDGAEFVVWVVIEWIVLVGVLTVGVGGRGGSPCRTSLLHVDARVAPAPQAPDTGVVGRLKSAGAKVVEF